MEDADVKEIGARRSPPTLGAAAPGVMRWLGWRRAFAVMVVWLCVCGGVGRAADEGTKPAPVKTPTAGEILDAYVAETGGKEAHAKLTSLVMKGTIELVDSKLQGELAMYARRPDCLRIEQRLAAQKVEMLSGFDGTTGWSRDPYNGLHKLSGERLDDLRRSAVFDDLAAWRTAFKEVKVTGEATVNERPCYVVELTSAGKAPPRKAYFDKERHLLCRLDSSQATANGRLKLTTFFKEYRAFAGVYICVNYLQSTPMGVSVVRITEVKVNEELPDTLFRMPAEPAPMPAPRQPDPPEKPE